MVRLDGRSSLGRAEVGVGPEHPDTVFGAAVSMFGRETLSDCGYMDEGEATVRAAEPNSRITC